MVAVLNVGQYGHWNDPQTQHKFWLNKLSVVYNVVLWRPESKQTDFSYHRYQVIKDMNARKDAYTIYSWRLLHDLPFHKFMLYTTFAKLTTDWNLVVTGKDLPIITISIVINTLVFTFCTLNSLTDTLHHSARDCPLYKYKFIYWSSSSGPHLARNNHTLSSGAVW